MVITAVFCNFLWGSAFPAVKTGYRLFGIAEGDAASQILFGGVRFTLAGILVILTGSLTARKPLVPHRSSVSRILKLCMFQTVFQYIFFNIGLAHTSGVKSSIIEATSVFSAILISGIIFRMEKITAHKLYGCLLGFIGVLLVNLTGNSLDMTFRINGEGFILISTVSYAFSTVMMKRYSEKENPVMLSGWQFVFGGMIMMSAGAAAGGILHMSSSACFPLMLYLAFISSTAYTLWGLLLKYHPVSKVTVYGFTNPVFGVLLSALILNEGSLIMHWQVLAALPLVCIGIWYVNRCS